MMHQITYVIHQLQYNIYLVYKFQPAIMNEWKDIREQTSDKDVMRSFWKEFQIYFNLFHNGPNYICDPSTTL